jgi:hypothetical protein
MFFITKQRVIMRTSRGTESMARLFAPHFEIRRPQNAHIHIDGFNNLVKYLVRLRRDGTLSDDDFSELVKMASAIFVETEISDRVESILENKNLDNLVLGLWK